MNYTYTLVNGELVEANAPIIPANNNDYFYGYSVYESIKVVQGVPLYLEEHLDRLDDSTKKLDMQTPYDRATITTYIAKLFAAEKPDRAMFKIWLFGGEAPLVMMFFRPLPVRTAEAYAQGVSVVTFPGHRFMPEIKSNCLLLSYLGLKKAKEQGADEALLLTEEDVLLEGATTNLFAIQNDTLITAPETAVLPGVTRAHILSIAKKLEIPVRFGDITLNQVREGAYSGCMISSTTRNVMALSAIDDIVLQKDPITDQLCAALEGMEQLEIEKIKRMNDYGI